MSWIGKLFSGDKEEGKSAAKDESAQGSGGEPATAAEVDAVFYRWLAGAGKESAPEATEKQILDELTRLAQAPAAGAALVPRLPAIIPQLMRSLRDEKTSATELSNQLAQDVVLVAEVFLEANRPCYRPRYGSNEPPITTIEAAIMLLGQNGMRMLLARVAFRPIMTMQTGRLAKLTAPLIWRQSEKCAMAGSMLASTMHANPFEAYLAGLMENVGLVVAFRLIDQMHSDEALPQSDEFIAGMFAQSRILSARIAELWEFPATVTGAIEQAGQPDASELAETLALADRVSKLRMLVDAMKYDPDAPFVVDGMDKFTLKCFDKLQDDDE